MTTEVTTEVTTDLTKVTIKSKTNIKVVIELRTAATKDRLQLQLQF